MDKDLTKEEKLVRDELTKIYPQLQINMIKTCGYNSDKWADDLLAVSVTFFLEKSLETQLKVIKDGKLEHYITFIAGTQVRSGSSKFYNYYRRFTTSQREIFDNKTYKGRMVSFQEPFEDEEDLVVTCIKKHMEELNPYEKMIINEKVVEGRTYKDISEQYDIPYSSLTNTADSTLKKLKKLCQHLY